MNIRKEILSRLSFILINRKRFKLYHIGVFVLITTYVKTYYIKIQGVILYEKVLQITLLMLYVINFRLNTLKMKYTHTQV